MGTFTDPATLTIVSLELDFGKLPYNKPIFTRENNLPRPPIPGLQRVEKGVVFGVLGEANLRQLSQLAQACISQMQGVRLLLIDHLQNGLACTAVVTETKDINRAKLAITPPGGEIIAEVFQLSSHHHMVVSRIPMSSFIVREAVNAVDGDPFRTVRISPTAPVQ